MVSPKLLGRRFGGVGGLTNKGEVGVEVVVSCLATMGKDAVEAARPVFSKLEVLTARFFRFRGFFAGVVGRCSSKKEGWTGSKAAGSTRRDRKSATKEDGSISACGDSGDVAGDGSVMEDESMVEMVVVGEESEDSDADVEALSRCWWKTEKGAFEPLGRKVKFPLDAGRATMSP
jgi:hypothetical protein